MKPLVEPPVPVYTAESPLFVLLNTVGKRGDGAEISATIERILREARRKYRIFTVGDRKTLCPLIDETVARAAAERGAIVAAGGDGTTNAVAAAAWRAGVPMGIIPRGTFNYFARNHGVELELEAATRALLHATPSPVQIGLINEQPFLVNASIGAYPLLLERQEHYKRRFGRKRIIAVLATALGVVREDRDWGVDIEAMDGKGETLNTRTLFVLANKLQAESLGIDEAATLERGRLIGIAMPSVTAWSMLRLLARSAVGRLGASNEVRTFGFRRLTIRRLSNRSRASLKLGMDGEVLHLDLPVTISVASTPLHLLVTSREAAP